MTSDRRSATATHTPLPLVALRRLKHYNLILSALFQAILEPIRKQSKQCHRTFHSLGADNACTCPRRLLARSAIILVQRPPLWPINRVEKSASDVIGAAECIEHRPQTLDTDDGPPEAGGTGKSNDFPTHPCASIRL